MQHSINDIQQAPISAVTTATEIVAAPGAGFKIVVITWMLSLDADGEFTWSSDATPITGTMEIVGETPTGASSSLGVLECAENEPLTLEATTAANGLVRWVAVRA